jgi:peptidyl-tRNA hydrolase, PTH1 family
MKLVIGLGNPGKEYELSRHNAGFLCLEEWSRKHNIGFQSGSSYDFALVKGNCLLKPKLFMNLSGKAVGEAMAKWNVTEALVVQDDIELPLGTLRLRNSGGDGGHNGIKSLLEIISGDDLRRIRIGIGRDAGDPRDYVLDNFTQDEMSELKPTLEKAGEFIDIFLNRDFNAVLDAYSIWKKSCSGSKGSGNERPKENNNDQNL